MKRKPKPFFSSYDEMLATAEHKIKDEFRNVIGYKATAHNTAPPDEACVRDLAASAEEFINQVSAEHFPDRADETAQRVKLWIGQMVESILSPPPTLH
jgi:hypothetical protein